MKSVSGGEVDEGDWKGASEEAAAAVGVCVDSGDRVCCDFVQCVRVSADRVADGTKSAVLQAERISGESDGDWLESED